MSTKHSFNTILSVLILPVMLLSFYSPASAQDNKQPSYGTAEVDGDSSEWNLTYDFFTSMYLGGNPAKEHLSNLYLRFDCMEQVMYVLVLPTEGLEVIPDNEEASIKISDGNIEFVVVEDTYDDDGVAPDFAWVGLDDHRALGWEASFPWDDSYVSIYAHTNIEFDGKSETSAPPDFIPIQIMCTDWGDLPNAYKNTLFIENGARHAIGGLYLGSFIDGEPDGQPSELANGDDNTSKDDDDGVTLNRADSWTAGSTARINVRVTGGEGYLYGWFNFNGNTSFDPGERIDLGFVHPGENEVSIPLLVQPVENLFIRFRLYPEPQQDPQPTGPASDGEVEDYLWSFKPTSVKISSLTAQPSGSSLLLYPLLAACLVFLVGAWMLRKRLHQS